MRILVTGSKGVVGKKICEELENRGHIVFGVDLLHYPGERGYTQVMSNEEGKYSRCDISEYRQLETVFDRNAGFDFVYNCAAEFGRGNGEDFYEQLGKSNVIGLKNIIRLQEKYGFNLIHFSSSEVYGDYPGVMEESILNQYPIKQMNDYAITKGANELQIGNSQIMDNTKTVIVRLFNTYGAGEVYHPYRSVNSKFCYHSLFDLPITVYRGHHRSSTYISDAVNALCNIVDNFIPQRIYNIGSDDYHDIETMADIIGEYTGADRRLIKYRESEKLTTKSKMVDISLAKKEIGLTNIVKLKEGIKLTLDWMRKYYA